MLYYIVGPTCSGKTKLVDRFVSSVESSVIVPTLTTRPIRASDNTNSVITVDADTFQEYVDNNLLLEYAEYASNMYGTLASVLDKAYNDNKLVFKIIEFNGLRTLLSKNLNYKYSIIYINPTFDSAYNYDRNDYEQRIKQDLTQKEYLFSTFKDTPNFYVLDNSFPFINSFERFRNLVLNCYLGADND